jgi:hypothetical protein
VWGRTAGRHFFLLSELRSGAVIDDECLQKVYSWSCTGGVVVYEIMLINVGEMP